MNVIRRVLLASVSVSFITACGVPRDDKPEQLSVVIKAVPVPNDGTETTMVNPNFNDQSVVIYLIRGQGLISEIRFVRSDFDIEDLYTELLSSPTSESIRRGARSGLADRSDLVSSVSVEDDFVNVALNDIFNELSGTEQTLVIGQITLTFVTNLPVKGVLFNQSNTPLAVPDADGAPVLGPVGRLNFVKLIGRP